MPQDPRRSRKATVQGMLIRAGMDVEHGHYRLAVRTAAGERFELEGAAATEDLQEMIGESIVVRGALELQDRRQVVHLSSYELLGLDEDDEYYDFDQSLHEDT